MIMKSVIASLIAVAGMSVAANGQQLNMLVSTDGLNFSSSVNANPGQTVQILVTASYTGTSTQVAGFGSAIFQPTVSNWHVGADMLLPLRQGGNTLPADGSGMIQPQFYTGVTAGSGTPVQAGYVAGTYGRVNPMGRTFLDGANAIRGWEHTNPNGDGINYLRIAQSNVSNWIGGAGNTDGLSGVNCAQLFLNGRTTSDPDFWGNTDTSFDSTFGWSATGRNPANDYRRQNVELFRFAITLDSSTTLRTLTVDAPLGGQQYNSSVSGSGRYMGFFTQTAASADPNVKSALTSANITDGFINVVPTPASLALLGLGGLVAGRRRRA
jgi:hypothetical protein